MEKSTLFFSSTVSGHCNIKEKEKAKKMQLNVIRKIKKDRCTASSRGVMTGNVICKGCPYNNKKKGPLHCLVQGCHGR
jgi:hypothetical protein